MYNLLFLPVALILVLVTRPYDLSYLGLAILVGIAIFIYDYVRPDGEAFKPQAGIWFLIIGSVCIAIALYESNSHGITFAKMEHVKAFPKSIRKLPYYGIALITIGVLVGIKSLLKGKDS